MAPEPQDHPAGHVTAAGYFCLRTPLLPFRVLADWSGTVARDKDRAGALRHALIEILKSPDVREAIFLASPALDEAIATWEEGPTGEHGRRVERALIKYLGRMAARCTPFGLFSAVATGTIGPTTRLAVPPRHALRRHTRIDNEFLFALARAISGAPEARAVLRYYPNDSLGLGGGRGHYAEIRPAKDGHTFHLVAVEASAPLEATLERAAAGATRSELAAALVDAETTREEADGFVDELIDSQLLVPELDLRVTGPEPGEALAADLERVPNGIAAAAAIRLVDGELRRLDSAGLGHPPARYRELARLLEPLPARVELPRLFQADLVRPDGGTLGRPVVEEIRRGVDLLRRITPGPDADELARFREAFQARYEGREVPLLEALDQEIGIAATLWPAGDPSPLVRDLPLDRPALNQVRWQERESLLLFRLGELARAGADEWELTPEDIERLAPPEAQALSPSFSVLATVAAASAGALDRGEYQLYLRGSDSPGTRMLGRFCHADPALAAQVRAQHRREEALAPDAIFAELVHLPAGRLGNILLRPLLREYEVTYLGSSGAPRERQIPASDLRLRLNDGRIELWSARLGRRVIPRLCSAHDFREALLPYRFLCQLQNQGCAPGLGWHWDPLTGAAFLPRVRAGRVVFALATWRLDRQLIRRLTRGALEQRLAELSEWRNRWRVPQWVNLLDGDHHLPIDLQNPLAVDCLLHELVDREEVRLQELWPAPGQLVAAGPEGCYTHELVVPFLTTAAAAPAPTAPAPAIVVKRRIPPGDEWLCLKLYAAPSTSDELLRDLIGVWSREWLARGRADGWYFIRYADPEPHLRWRLHGRPEALAEGRAELEADVGRRVAAGQLWRAQVDTYEREVERYGGPLTIELAERIFQADSEVVLELLDLVEPGDAGLDERWQLGLFGTDRWFDAFGLSLAERLTELDRSRRYGSVPSPDTGLRRQLSDRFRAARPSLEALLEWAGDDGHPLAPGLELLTERSARVAPLTGEFRRLAAAAQLTAPLGRIAGSMIHMHLNRLLRDAANAHETVIYDFLRRLYQSRIARRDASGSDRATT